MMKKFFVVLLLTATLVPAQSTTAPNQVDEATEESGSGVPDESTAASTEALPTTTPSLDCESNCGADGNCPDGCECTEELAKDLNGICAEPCDPNKLWCSTGTECAPTNSGYKCDCSSGFYESGTECLSGKFFGGQITFAEVNVPDDSYLNETIEKILNSIYNSTDYYVGSFVYGVSAPENSQTREVYTDVVADYQLTYKNEESVSDQILQECFNKSCNSSSKTTSNYTVDCDASRKTVTVRDALCSKDPPPINCDLETANCHNDNGISWCSCKDEYTKTYESTTMCFKIKCEENSDCNSPFGWCTTDGVDAANNECTCMWGFTGEHCYDPWEFVFTIVVAGLGLILIVALTACICANKKSKKTAVPQEDLNLKNPFIDFQPGLVRAKEVPSNLYNVSDSFDMRESSHGAANSHANGAYDSLHDETHNVGSPAHQYASVKQTEYF